MKTAIVGGAGRQSLAAIYDLVENKDVESLLLVDIDEEALIRREKLINSEKIKTMVADATNTGKMSEALMPCDVVLNCSTHLHNMDIMAACIESKTNFTDLGGLFKWTLRQLNRYEDFKKAGITGITGSGSAPGIVNVMAKYAADKLDTIESILILDAIVNPQAEEIFIPPYALSTIIEQFSMNNFEFVNGEMVEKAPFSGEYSYSFAEPYGTIKLHNMIHSEVATMPITFKDKGIKNVSFKLAMPKAFEEQLSFLMKNGMGSREKININGNMISPRDVMLAMFERDTYDSVHENPQDVKLLRVFVEGTKDGKPLRYKMKCNLHHYYWGLMNGFFSVGFPAAITMRMLGNGLITEKGFFSGESVIDPNLYFRELSRRNVIVECNVSERV